MTDTLIPAAVYARMSTEDQKYSIVNQESVITEYAVRNGYSVVAKFTDPGISGLDLKHRPGLKALLESVVSGNPAFKTILVLDVSRWGRFQDIDESAFYEFFCRKAGVEVRYCAEPFANDLTPLSNLLKALKRTMAAEYSRELSTKVFLGQARLAAMGFKQGGLASIGMRRMLVDENGKPKHLLQPGERKSLAGDRVIFVRGPASEVRFVRGIFQTFLGGESIPSIARRLRKEQSFGRRWTEASLRVLLQHPKYAGTCVFNQTSQRLKTTWRRLPREQWITKPNSFEPVVPPELFKAVQEKMERYTIRQTDAEFLRRLKALWNEKGYLTQDLIAASPGMPCPSAYYRRFGSLMEAYRRIGFTGTLKVSPYSTMVAHRRMAAWTELKKELRAAGIRLRRASDVPYKIHCQGLPLFNFVAARSKGTQLADADGPEWDIWLPGSSRVENLIVMVLSWEHETIEYAVCPCIRKFRGKRFALTLPELIGMSVCRARTAGQLARSMKALRGSTLRNE
jgi:DNA invertase Pin-like site-specific DNA recombinase